MKYIVFVPDGMADYPLEELGNRTPLEVARTPNMDFLAQNGKIGTASFVPKGMTPGSDVANLAIFGYDPEKYFSGRAPLEAINLGVELGEKDIAFRCNFITEENGLLIDYSAGHISTKEAQVLIKVLNRRIPDKTIRFYPGVSYRHLMVINDASEELLKLKCYPPHDIMGKKIADCLPQGKACTEILGIMQQSKDILNEHEINLVRIDLKENPANMIWLWGQGKKIVLPSFRKKYGVSGSVISAVDLIKGIGRAIGLTPIDVPGATGYYDTDYEAKARYALDSLKRNDFVFIHVEAPDEAGHNGDVRAKIAAIENFDRLVIGTVLNTYNVGIDPLRILLMPDHPTPISLRTHTADPVCFLIFGTGIAKDEFIWYNENEAKKSRLVFSNGYELMDCFIKQQNL
ncbi:MAG: cofactor-independent phosphoglycerate mutase [Candidatus Omnitrophica bacterium]|nr:cofactor-independent phosphoglycerate mutase [Candidatus Omnitrophota bacterium]MBU4478140.1 cofactor-independent phosphoglycerate mutase [Candidatus Omnitrophota bacterium]